MIILDENIPESQRLMLTNWRIKYRQIGIEIGKMGIQDDAIISLLLKYNRPTFFTLDSDFNNRKLCHPRYCLIFLDVGQYEAASFIRRFLRFKKFDTMAKRMGAIIRLSHMGLLVWRRNFDKSQKHYWNL